MKEKINNIIDRLCSHEISKNEAKQELLNLHNVIEPFSFLQIVEWNDLKYWVIEDNMDDTVLIANATNKLNPEYDDWWVDRDELNALR